MPTAPMRHDPATTFFMDRDSVAAEFINNNQRNFISYQRYDAEPNKLWFRMSHGVLASKGLMLNTNAVNMVHPIVNRAGLSAADNTTGSVPVGASLQLQMNDAMIASKMKNSNYVMAMVNLGNDAKVSDILQGKKDLVLEAYITFNDVSGASRM